MAVPALVLVAAAALLADTPAASQSPIPPDERFKADVLLVVAHPDDDTLVSPFLIRALEQKRRVAVVYGTRGDAGGNAVGQEQAAALAAVREIEARRALASLGVVNVWFLDGRDTASQDVLNSLETWGHGGALEKTVRYVRLTRPEIVLTWLPVSVVGENHGDHQAAAVLATEAFDLSGDPTAFPAQLAPPRDRRTIDNLGEGLRPWTPKKLYFFSDASGTSFLKGFGPEYSVTDISPVQKAPYASLAVRHWGHYPTQIDAPEVRRALAAGTIEDAMTLLARFDEHFWDPLRLVLGKSRVGGEVTGDVFEGVGLPAAPPSPRPTPSPRAPDGVSLSLGGPWAFYREFWRAHGLERLQELARNEIALPGGGRAYFPLLIRNGGIEDREVTLRLAQPLPTGWSGDVAEKRYFVPAGEARSVTVIFTTPEVKAAEWMEIRYEAESGGRPVGTVSLRVRLGPGGLPQ
jgi:LmbE family N-acetylglucosaminyl deacetylase